MTKVNRQTVRRRGSSRFSEVLLSNLNCGEPARELIELGAEPVMLQRRVGFDLRACSAGEITLPFQPALKMIFMAHAVTAPSRSRFGGGD